MGASDQNSLMQGVYGSSVLNQAYGIHSVDADSSDHMGASDQNGSDKMQGVYISSVKF
jgi:hypothetical protein